MATYRGLDIKVGVKVLSNKLPELPDELETLLQTVVAKTVFDLEGWVKTLLEAKGAVDTGNLRDSVTSYVPEGGPLRGIVATAVEYAPYVEYGTVHMAARTAWFPATEKVRPAFTAAAKQVLAGLGA